MLMLNKHNYGEQTRKKCLSEKSVLFLLWAKTRMEHFVVYAVLIHLKIKVSPSFALCYEIITNRQDWKLVKPIDFVNVVKKKTKISLLKAPVCDIMLRLRKTHQNYNYGEFLTVLSVINLEFVFRLVARSYGVKIVLFKLL